MSWKHDAVCRIFNKYAAQHIGDVLDSDSTPSPPLQGLSRPQPTTTAVVLLSTKKPVAGSNVLNKNDSTIILRFFFFSGFLETAVAFVLKEAPSVPPHLSAAGPLPAASSTANTGSGGSGGGGGGDWKAYFERAGLPAAMKMLAGLCRGHAGAQGLLAERGLLERLHWMEGTSTSGEVNRKKKAHKKRTRKLSARQADCRQIDR